MTFLPECGTEAFLPIKWVHNDFMYVRFAGKRNTKTWSKSSKMCLCQLKTQAK